MDLPRLLYAEDDTELAEMTIEVLSDHYSVDHVTDGDAALRSALNHHYVLMVFDRRLPGRDGIALVRAVRTARIATPILLLTALGAVDDRVEGLDAGANDYLVKPFAFEELLDAAFRPGSEPLGPGSVDTYVHYVRRKTIPDIIETVRGRGYRLGSPE